jgi:hypothetical protein
MKLAKVEFFIIGIISIKRKENLVKHALQIMQWQRGSSGLGGYQRI